MDKYKERHRKISQFYGDKNPETYKKYFDEIETINEMHDYGKELINGFTFNLDKDLDQFDVLIIKKYTNTKFYKSLNAMLFSPYFYEASAYITAKLMHSLNRYAMKEKQYCDENQKILYRGIPLSYTCLLQYERAKGKIICFQNFISTSENKNTAKKFSGRVKDKEENKVNLEFSVIYKITNIYQNGFISNGVNVQKISQYDEKEYLFQPFSFFYLKDIHIDIDKKTAKIFLETVGKKEILEEKLRGGSEIKYSRKNNIMEIK